ncbi:hypothetical protein MCEMSEM23_01116 [Rhabdaerophilaceae bacterium]
MSGVPSPQLGFAGGLSLLCGEDGRFGRRFTGYREFTGNCCRIRRWNGDATVMASAIKAVISIVCTAEKINSLLDGNREFKSDDQAINGPRTGKPFVRTGSSRQVRFAPQ